MLSATFLDSVAYMDPRGKVFGFIDHMGEGVSPDFAPEAGPIDPPGVGHYRAAVSILNPASFPDPPPGPGRSTARGRKRSAAARTGQKAQSPTPPSSEMTTSVPATTLWQGWQL